MGKLFDELKRRNVIRVAVAYIVMAWVLLQVADLVLDAINAPTWVMQAFMLAVALAFPVALLFSWAYEITPEGLKREKDVDRSASVTHETAQKLDRITIGMLLLVLAITAVDRYLPKQGDAPVADESAVTQADSEDDPGTPVSTTPAAATIESNSIAVLAFEDLSPDGDQEFFADGISEELLNVLAKIPDLQVAGRTSSFAFKGKQVDLREIGEILQVAHILEGSVRKSGNRVRVTAQLVKADDGFHLFSENYDRELDDIFAVQDDIAKEITAALRATLTGEVDTDSTPVTSPDVYEKFLQARQWLYTRNRELMERALNLLDEALAIDPDYAPAHAQKALAILLLSDTAGAYGDIPNEEAQRLSLPHIERAEALDPESADAHAVRGLYYMHQGSAALREAIASLERALALNPNHANALAWLADQYRQAGDERSMQLLEQAVQHDPVFRPALTALVGAYTDRSQTDRADALIRRAERILGPATFVQFAKSRLQAQLGETAAAVRLAEQALLTNPDGTVVASNLAFYKTALGDYEGASEIGVPVVRLVPMHYAGREADAAAAFEAIAATALSQIEVEIAADYLLTSGQTDRLLDWLAGMADSGEDWLSTLSDGDVLSGPDHMTTVIHALQQVGRTAEANALMSRAEAFLEEGLARGADNSWFWQTAARLAAVQGDTDSMYQYLERALERNYLDAQGFYPPMFDPYRGEARFIKLQETAVRRANEERRKLGMLAL